MAPLTVTNQFTYDVFLSFRGEDTRYGFTGNLKKALDDSGVQSFIDDEELQKGNEITESLLNAIEDSNMAIVVLSENYASSSFCLQELSKILDSINNKGRCVHPVFYKVDPSDVRKLKNSYGKAMAKHEGRCCWPVSNPNVDKWKASLHQVANLSGSHYKGDEYECDFIKKIVDQILRNTKPIVLHAGDYLVGLEHQKQYLTSLLNIGSDDTIHMVGIHGIGGIGKTTLALEVYNSIVHQFQSSCFLEKVRENSNRNGLIYLQKILLSRIVGEKNMEFTSVAEGISILQQRLHQKKVLLLLDDVDNLEQLEAIAGRSKWFGPGSRVIITTRDIRLLTRHEVERTYEVMGLNDEDAFDLVGWKALKNEYSPSFKDILSIQKYGRELMDLNVKVFPGYAHVLKRAVAYASGLPLALEVIGSHFFKKTIEECKCALDRYERVPDKKIQTTLQLSFDALREEEKFVFLDIACCFNGWKLARVEEILHAHHGDIMKDHINVLVEKSLIKISKSGDVTLHDLIEDMGKEINRQESPEDPGERTRLWDYEDIKKVFKEDAGTSNIKIIHFPFEEQWEDLDGKAFKKMKNLKTLIFSSDVYCYRTFKDFPNSLRVLEYSLRVLEYSNGGRHISCFHAWDSFLTKKFENMRVLNLDRSYGLRQIRDISGLPNLEVFSIQNCGTLIAIDKSVGFLRKLKILRFISCTGVKSIPPLSLASLEILDLSYCDDLESFPLMVDGFVGKLKVLRVIKCPKIRMIPSLMLPSLEELDLTNCTGLKSFPSVVDGFGDKLKTVSVKGCYNLKSIPPLKLDSLEKLDISNCYKLESFPIVVDGLLDKLKFMNIENCIMLRKIPRLRLTSLEHLNLSCCYSLESFPELLGEMRNIPGLLLDETPIKEFPFQFQTLAQPQRFVSCDCGYGRLPNRDVVMSESAELTIKAEEKVCPIQSSYVKYICVRGCKLSDEYLSINLMLFANVKELHLTNIEFTILPKSIEECHFLWKLVLDDCTELHEIKGIPPRLRVLSAVHCISLTSSCKSKLLNQELHEARNTCFRLPRVPKIPEWFDHKCEAGLTISFWFRNKFPAIALCFVSPLTFWFGYHGIRVSINGNSFIYKSNSEIRCRQRPDMYHLHLFHMQTENFNDNMGKALLENKWNHAEIYFGVCAFMYSGIHVLKEKNSMEDIRFTNPANDANIVLHSGC